VVLIDVEGLSYAEAAEVLGWPKGTVRSRVHRGRRALRTHSCQVQMRLDVALNRPEHGPDKRGPPSRGIDEPTAQETSRSIRNRTITVIGGAAPATALAGAAAFAAGRSTGPWPPAEDHVVGGGGGGGGWGGGGGGGGEGRGSPAAVAAPLPSP
jgi:hypothetical protein